MDIVISIWILTIRVISLQHGKAIGVVQHTDIPAISQNITKGNGRLLIMFLLRNNNIKGQSKHRLPFEVTQKKNVTLFDLRSAWHSRRDSLLNFENYFGLGLML